MPVLLFVTPPRIAPSTQLAPDKDGMSQVYRCLMDRDEVLVPEYNSTSTPLPRSGESVQLNLVQKASGDVRDIREAATRG